MLDLLGKPADEIVGGTCWKIMHGTDGPVDGCPILRMEETMRPETLVLPMGDRWFRVSVYPVLDEAGDLGAAVHIISDITAAKQAEVALSPRQRRTGGPGGGAHGGIAAGQCTAH